jgi:hypothetical protein
MQADDLLLAKLNFRPPAPICEFISPACASAPGQWLKAEAVCLLDIGVESALSGLKTAPRPRILHDYSERGLG